MKRQRHRIILEHAVVASNEPESAYEIWGSLLAMNARGNVRLYEVKVARDKYEFQMFVQMRRDGADHPQWLKMFSTSNREQAVVNTKTWADDLVFQNCV